MATRKRKAEQEAQQVDPKVSKVLPPGASVRDFGLHMAALFPIRTHGWNGVSILSIARPEGADYNSDEKEVEYLDDDGHVQVATINDTERKKVHITSKTFQKKEVAAEMETEEEEEEDDKWAVEKERVNRVVTHLINTLHRKRREVVVLDHYKLRTSTMLSQLKKRGEGRKHLPLLTRDKIHVPNADPTILAKVSAASASLATITQETLLEWINRQDTEDEDLVASFDVLADYCCMWEGNATCHPSLDLHAMFRKTLLAKTNAVLWLTFSTRGTTAAAVKAKVQEWLDAEALVFDYSLTLAYSKSYGHIVTMVYVTGRSHYQMGEEGFAYLNNV